MKTDPRAGILSKLCIARGEVFLAEPDIYDYECDGAGNCNAAPLSKQETVLERMWVSRVSPDR